MTTIRRQNSINTTLPGSNTAKNLKSYSEGYLRFKSYIEIYFVFLFFLLPYTMKSELRTFPSGLLNIIMYALAAARGMMYDAGHGRSEIMLNKGMPR